MMLLLVVPIATPTEGSSIIVVVTEICQIVEFIGVNVLAPLVVVISHIVHVFLVEERVPDPEEERVVEHPIH